MANVVGIDLGTTNSCVSVVLDGTPKVIPNKAGYKTTPSIVAISESGRRLVGQMAKRQAITNARHTVYAAKRLIGRKWGSPAVLHSLETCPYQIVQGPHEDVRVKLRDKVYSVPEVSSMILQEMKLIAEEYLGEEVTQAVITVPAYFNDNQRQATKDAGRIAGLDVLRIINEPTAAALAYGYGKDLDQTIAIYDLGGGTFDISVLEISEGVFDVMATSGDTFLGGEDFDARVIEWLTLEFAAEHRVDLRKDDMALQRLKDAAEKAKIELSTLAQSEVNLPFIFTRENNETLHLQRTLSRDKLEELVADLVQRTIKICNQTLEEAQLSIADVDEVILVGGMTRMPAVQRAVNEFFKRTPKKGVHPDEVVAIGAAIQAQALVHEDTEVLLLDVTPHSLGIMVYGGGFEIIIEKNSTVPTSQSHIFTTVRDNQTSVKILVLQGESLRAEENELLGEFVLTGLRKAAAGEVEVEVTFDISADGIVSVRARDLETGKAQSITVTATSGLTEDEIKKMITENAEYMVQVRQSEEVDAKRDQIRRAVREIEKVFPEVESALGGSALGQDALAKARDAVTTGKSALGSNSMAQLSSSAEALERTLQVFTGILERAT
ncbi:MAG: molecular chaperone DnaK [Myxococcales bacterium]|nr:molecular chaperone DnaK [Myxococcales bacterium]MCB9531076.1 molecular chaperone DnaK [Myxococcales bacterium]MCB9532986.1 molecular chaperone DnaK [Myxococcales bacterium]